MRRLPVESSDIVAIGYDPKEQILEIEFREGRLYQYLAVESDVHERFMRADSFGQYFDAFVNGHYRYHRIDAEEAPTYQSVAFATGNQRKFRDLQRACQPFGIEVEQVSVPTDEIQSHDVAEIAAKKAKQAFRLAGRPVVVNDSFWNILALRGFPGAYARYINEWLTAEEILRLLEGKRDRTVILTDTLVYYDGKRTKVFARDYSGAIADEPHGTGLPLQQIIRMNGQTQTIAELAEQGTITEDSAEGIWHDFAKWYNLQRRLGKV